MSSILPKKETKTISYTDREKRMHKSWCIKNDIKIYFLPEDDHKGRIVVEIYGIPEIGAHVYKNWKARLYKKDEKWYEIINKLYTQYYEERHTQKGFLDSSGT